MLQVAMLSRWHVHADGYARQVIATGKAQIAAVWDDDTARGEAWAKDLGARFEPSLDTLLADPAIDAVIVDTPTTDHDDVIARAARAGKSIFTEKALSVTGDGAAELVRLIRAAGKTFVISLPHMAHPATLATQDLLRQGALGQPVKLRFRNAHGGKADNWLPQYWYDLAKTGGGALFDLGCHPVYLANALFGLPRGVSAVFSPPGSGRQDEEATVVLDYADGSQAILETGFLTPFAPRLFEVYGTRGTLLAENNDVRVCLRPEDGSKAVFQPLSDVREAPPAPIEAFVEACLAGHAEVPEYGLQAAIDLSRVLEWAYHSAAQGCRVAVDGQA